MKALLVKRRTAIGFTMALVITPLFLYYLFFVQSQKGYLTERNFRVLANIGDEMKAKVDNLATSLVNAATKVRQEDTEHIEGKRHETKKRVPVAPKLKEAIELIDSTGSTNDRVDRQSKVGSSTQPTVGNNRVPEARPRSVSNAKVDSGTWGPARMNERTNSNRSSIEIDRSRTSESRSVVLDRSQPSVDLTVKQERGSFRLRFEYHDGARQLSFPVEAEMDKVFEPIVARYVIDELSDTQNRLFDKVLVAEQNGGRVIFERGRAELRIVSLSSLVVDKVPKVESKPTDKPSTQSDLDSVAGSSPPKNAPKPTIQYSSLLDVELAGAQYKLFVQPIPLTLSTGEARTSEAMEWLVCGLTRADHFRGEGLAVSDTLLITFSLMVVLAALSLPFLKLRLMGQHDRLRRRDVVSLAFSAVLATAVVTFLLADNYTYNNFENQLDYQLRSLSLDIQSHTSEELGSALAQLSEVNERINIPTTKEHSTAFADVEGSRRMPNSRALDPMTPFSSKRNVLSETIDWKTAPYPYFNSITCADSSGLQRIKWTTRPETTAFTDVSGRSYFTKARDGNFWKLSFNGKEYEYAFELVNSMSTGENVAIVSTRMPNSNWISSLDTRLLSLMGTALPGGYGYAVIRGDGLVLFHSAEAKNLRENFFDECGNDGRLRALVLGRASEFINVQYAGSEQRAFVTPLGQLPWSLIVLRDKNVSRSFSLASRTLSLFLLLACCLIFGVLAAGVYILKPGVMRWLRPDADYALRYKQIILVNVLLCGVSVVILLTLDEWKLIGIPVGLACGTFIPMALGEPRPVHSAGNVPRYNGVLRFLSFRQAHAFAVVSVLVLWGVLPTLAFIKVARDFEIKSFVRVGQVSFSDALETRSSRVSQQFSWTKIGKLDEGKNAFLKRRLDPTVRESSWDVYDRFFFNTQVQPSEPVDWVKHPPSSFQRLLAAYRPVYNRAAPKDPDSYRGGTDYSFLDEGEGLMRLDTEAGLSIRSSLPSLGQNESLLWWLAVGLFACVGLAILLKIIQATIGSICLTRLSATHGPPGQSLVLKPVSQNLIVLRFPMASRQLHWDPEYFYRIDFQQGVAKQLSLGAYDYSGIKADLAVVIDNFELRADDPPTNREKLRLVESLLSEGRHIVIVSSRHPSQFALSPRGSVAVVETAQGHGSHETSGKSASEVSPNSVHSGLDSGISSSSSDATRWEEAFADFVTVPDMDKADEAFVERHRAFFRLLKTEGRPWRYLQTIGEEIMQQRGLQELGVAKDLAADELLRRVRERAQTFHKALWSGCSQEERLALIHLARDGFISPANDDVRQLLKRGYLVFGPSLRLLDESFRLFVMSAARTADLSTLKNTRDPSVWAMVKGPMLVLLLMSAVFLFLTQKERYDSVVGALSTLNESMPSLIAYLSALTGAIAVLFRLFDVLNKSKQEPLK